MRFKENLKQKFDIIGFVLPIFTVLLWYLVTLEGGIPKYILPSPVDVIKVFIDYAFGNLSLTPYSGDFLKNCWASSLRVLGGFGLAALLGLPLGYLTGIVSVIKRIVDPTVHLLRAIPGIGWLPVAMVWFGVGTKTTIFLIALAAFFPIYVNSAQGAMSIDPLIIRAGKMLGAKKATLFTTIILPASLSSVRAGLRLGLGISWAYLVLGELTGVASGLGAVMMDARMLGHTDVVLVSMVYIAIMGWISDRILVYIFKLFQPRLDGAK